MGRTSSIEQLPHEVLEQLQQWLRDPRVTQLDATDRINAVIDQVNAGLPEEEQIEHVSKSALNRYKQRMDRHGEKLRQSREIASMWISNVGRTDESQLGQLNNEMIRTLAFEVNMLLQDIELNEKSMPGVISMIKDMSLTMQRLEKAASDSVKREAEIKKQAAEDAAEAAETAVRKAGLSDDGVAAMRTAILQGM